jgi:hypothetical protein
LSVFKVYMPLSETRLGIGLAGFRIGNLSYLSTQSVWCKTDNRPTKKVLLASSCRNSGIALAKLRMRNEIGYAGVSTDDRDTAAWVATIKAAGGERIYCEKASCGRIVGHRLKLSPQHQAEIRRMVSKGSKTASRRRTTVQNPFRHRLTSIRAVSALQDRVYQITQKLLCQIIPKVTITAQ